MENKTLYLLTGAAGFLGSNICQQLLDRGDKVRAFVLNGDPAIKYIQEGVEIFEGNLCDVCDLASGTIAAADKGRRGECYILGNKEVTLKEAAKILHRVSGCKTPLVYIPIPMAYKLAKKMEKG